jgi:hypothetical protein
VIRMFWGAFVISLSFLFAPCRSSCLSRIFHLYDYCSQRTIVAYPSTYFMQELPIYLLAHPLMFDFKRTAANVKEVYCSGGNSYAGRGRDG